MATDPNEPRPMTAEELRRHCSRLYGAHRWQTALSRELQVNDRTVRRWAAGTQDRCATGSPKCNFPHGKHCFGGISCIVQDA